MKNKDPYKEISKEYDQLIGPRDEVEYLKKLMPKAHPQAKSMLELACGTGTLLKHFREDYVLSGLDQSRNMLRIAKRMIPEAEFYLKDMRNFKLAEKFDLVTCLFNSINHLRTFSDWKSTFRSARRHLNPSGVFIFDIMTSLGLRNYAEDPHKVSHSKDSVMTTEYSLQKDGAFEFRACIFSRKIGNLYYLKETRIIERAFEEEEVKAALSKHFKKIEVIDPDRKKPSKDSEVLYFVCRVNSSV